MEIIPVIDILNGIVVHAVRGERNTYKPVKSVLSSSTDPIEIASIFRRMGFRKLYVADLNAILKKGDNYEIIKRICESTSLEVMVDAGVVNIPSAVKIFECKSSELVIGTETLNELEFIRECSGLFGKDKVVVSIDIKDGKLLGPKEIREMKVGEVVSLLKRMGIENVIILNLSKVGTLSGPDLELIDSIPEETRRGMRVIVGGGVKNINDIVELKKRGVYGVLVATSLHSGNITPEEIKQVQKDSL